MDDFTKQYNKDLAILFSPILFFIISGLIGFFALKIGILNEPSSMALAAILAFCSLVGYLIFTFKYRQTTKKMGLIVLEETRNIISAGEIMLKRGLCYSAFLSGVYKNNKVGINFCNTWVDIDNPADFYPAYRSFINPAQIGINFYTENVVPKTSVFGLLFSKPKRVTTDIVLKNGILTYKPIALIPFFNYTDRKQKFISILDELAKAVETIKIEATLNRE